jgi:1,4-dihydroxy-2-naphthoate octaprenyltransferase
VIPLLLGQALAVAAGHGWNWHAAIAIHSFGIIDHLYIVFANDWADRDSDSINETPTMFSGGSRVLIDGGLKPKSLARAAILMAVLLVALSIFASIHWSAWLWLAAAASALLLLFLYSFPPFRLSYRGGGEVLQGLGVGLVLPSLGFYGQAGTLDGIPVFALIGCVLLGIASNIATSLPDQEADRKTEKWTIAARTGMVRANRIGAKVTYLGIALLLIAGAGHIVFGLGLMVVMLAAHFATRKRKPVIQLLGIVIPGQLSLVAAIVIAFVK